MARRKRKLTYINKGGTFRLADQTIIKPNQKFKANPDEIPAVFGDSVICLEEDQLESAEIKDEEVKKPEYEIEADETPGWYNIKHKETGKLVNENKLREDQAKEELEKLNQASGEVTSENPEE